MNFANARFNPNAQTRNWDIEENAFGDDDEANPVIDRHLRKMDCGRITDGSCAVVLASGAYTERWTRRRAIDMGSVPRLKGWGHTTAPTLLPDKLKASQDDPYVFPHFPHVRKAATDAMARAGIGSPRDLDAIEVHDCFSISEYVAIDHFGLTAPGQSWRADEDLWDSLIAVNLYGSLRTTKAFLPGMIAGGWGRIVNISSDAGRVGSSGEGVYSACKGGQIAFTKTIAREVARKGVTVNCVCPGPTDTPPVRRTLAEGGEKYMQALVRAIPMRRLGQPEDIAAAVAYLVSEDAGFVTGQTLSVSGGMSMC